MPVPWIPVPWTALPATPPAVVQQAETTKRFSDDLIVTAKSGSFDIATRTYHFYNGVTATYGQTIVKCDDLEVHDAPTDAWAIARGHVNILDPDATMSADNLRFCWQPENRTASGENISISSGRAHIRAGKADLKPDLWVFEKVEVTNCPEYYWVKSPRVIVHPGKTAKLEDPTLYLFGKRIISIPDRNFNLDPRTQGIGLPTLSYRSGQGFGASFDGGLLLNENTNLYLQGAVFPQSYPTYGATVTRSFLPAAKADSIVTPGSELGERFRFGYFDNIQVKRPVDELRYMRTERNSISANSLWNYGVSGRDYDTFVSKAFEVVYERGGRAGATKAMIPDEAGNPQSVMVGGLSYVGQSRLQTIRERGHQFETRMLLIGSVEAPSIQLASDLSTLSRVDFSEFLGSRQFGWARAQVGVVYEPNKQVRLSGAVYGSAEHGQSQYRFDELVGKHGAELRADFDLGPTKFSYLQKYDTKLKWYDREYTVSQVAGCIEPFLVYRKFPQTYTLGVRLRIDDFSELLSRRNFGPRKPSTTVISSQHDGH